MDYQIISLEEFKLIGIEKNITDKSNIYKDRESLLLELRKTSMWQKILVQDKEIVYLHADYDTEYKPHSLMIGLKENGASGEMISDNLIMRSIPASKYAVFHINNKNIIKGIYETWDWIKESDLQRTYTNDFEYYAPPHQHEATIYIAVK